MSSTTQISRKKFDGKMFLSKKYQKENLNESTFGKRGYSRFLQTNDLDQS